MLIIRALLIGASLIGLTTAVQPLETRGPYFVNPKTNKRFQIVGVAYQPKGASGYNAESMTDPLTDGEVCKRDAALMQSMGINAIRVYNLNPKANHDECASVFNAAGMYMLLDVNSPLQGESISRTEPWTSYYDSYLERTFGVVEAFKNYPNTLAFFAGNEVIDALPTAKLVPPYMRAVTRDLKQYIANHSSRKIAVGYSAADVRSILFDTHSYLECSIDGNDDDMSRADIFALNSYSWCGKADFKSSSFDKLVSGFQNTAVPVFFSEYGCNQPYPRLWDETQSIYGPDMNQVFSGGIVYEYSQEPSNYGLVEIEEDGTAKLLQDFQTLSSQLAKLDQTKLQSLPIDGQRVKVKPPRCDSSLIKDPLFNNNFTVPSVPQDRSQSLIKNGISNPNRGKIIPIKDFNFKYAVKGVDGSTLSNIRVKPLNDDSSNQSGAGPTISSMSVKPTSTTGTVTSSASSTSSSAPSATSGMSNSNGGANNAVSYSVAAISFVAGIFAML